MNYIDREHRFPTYSEAMGDDGTHIRLKLDTTDPIALSDFIGEFVGIGNQFEKFVAREYPALKADSQIYIKEVRSGCIEADMVAWIMNGAGAGLLTYAGSVADAIDKVQILGKFVQSFGTRLGKYFVPGGRNENASKSDLVDFFKATQAIANDPNGSARLEAAAYEDGKRQVRAVFSFSTPEAKQAELELADHRRELEARTDKNENRVLLRFVRPSVEASKPGKKGGERGVIESLDKRALTILYASDLAERRMRHEKMQLEGNVFRALFDVSVNVELGPTSRPVAYRITEVHAVLDNEGEGDLLDG